MPKASPIRPSQKATQNKAPLINAATIAGVLEERLQNYAAGANTQDASYVTEVGDGIALVRGLESAMTGELLEFTSSLTNEHVYGLVQNLEVDEVGTVLFGDVASIREGDRCRTTGRVMDIPAGPAMLGRVINPLGEPIDGKGPITCDARRPIEHKAPGIMERKPVCEPVQTGLIAIDAMIPIGRGQRELIIGDRKTGKTAIAIDAIINQAKSDMICIYVAIGQKGSTIAAIQDTLERHGAMDRTIIIAATASDSAPLQYIAPMAGAAIGEYFMNTGADDKPANKKNPGRSVLVVYDDLSKQAVAYRQMSLTLHRPPGREAYPGDIFYLHSRLLERACKLDDEHGGGSLTALPIIETQEGDIAAYIPTNVISITDGQIYLQSNLFFQGQRPAVDVGISVSRVGGGAQIKAMKQVAGNLRLDLASFAELQSFSQFGSDLDKATQNQLTRGARMIELLRQRRFSALDVQDQVAVIFAGNQGYLDDIPINQVIAFRDGFVAYLKDAREALRAKIAEGRITDPLAEELKSAIEHYKQQFSAHMRSRSLTSEEKEHLALDELEAGGGSPAALDETLAASDSAVPLSDAAQAQDAIAASAEDKNQA